MNRQTLLGLLLSIVTLFSSWWAWEHRPTSAAPTTADNRADSVFETVTLTTTNPRTGLESLTVQTPHLLRQTSDGTGVLTTPVFYLPDQKSTAYWTLRAQRGLLSANGQRLQLQQDVRADSPPTADHVPTTFRTEHLTIYPNQQLAKTTDRVTLTQPGIRQTGVGFEADLKSKSVMFFSNVQSRYDPAIAHQIDVDRPSDPTGRFGAK